jgi:hypothetical protein
LAMPSDGSTTRGDLYLVAISDLSATRTWAIDVVRQQGICYSHLEIALDS